MANENENPNPTPAPAAPVLSGVAAQVSEILTTQAPHLSQPQREMILSLSKTWPSGDITDRLNASLDAFTPTVTYRGRGGAAAAPARPFDPGAPSGGSASKLPMDPLALPPDVVNSMTKEQALAWWEAYKQSGGKPEHPFAAARRAEKENMGNLTSQVAAAVAEALGKLR